MLIKHYKDFSKSEEEIIEDVKKLIKEKELKKIEKDKYNNPEHIKKRQEEMDKIKEIRDKEKQLIQEIKDKRNKK